LGGRAVGAAVGATVAGAVVGATVAAEATVGASVMTWVGAAVTAGAQAERVIEKMTVSASKRNVRRLFIYFSFYIKIFFGAVSPIDKMMITRNICLGKRFVLKNKSL